VANDVGNPIVHNVGPKELLAQEDWRTRRQPQYADIGVLNVTVFRPTELGPLGIVDLAGKDINSVSLRRKSESKVFYVDKLATKVRMLAPVAIQWIEIPLWVQKCDMHQALQALLGHEDSHDTTRNRVRDQVRSCIQMEPRTSQDLAVRQQRFVPSTHLSILDNRILGPVRLAHHSSSLAGQGSAL